MKGKTVYEHWLILHRNFPTPERFGLGNRIDSSFLNLLENIFICIYLSSSEKINKLHETIAILDKIRFLTQIAWENKLVAHKSYASLSEELEEIGRQLGGWRRGLLTKTPA